MIIKQNTKLEQREIHTLNERLIHIDKELKNAMDTTGHQENTLVQCLPTFELYQKQSMMVQQHNY